jgi:fatty acid desaturase
MDGGSSWVDIRGMHLRFSADVRTMFWAFVLFPGVAALSYVYPQYAPWFIPLSLYTGFCSGVIAHYHNHCPVWESRRANSLFSIWISMFYGYPIFAWIPTHNMNHHKFVNGPGDATITWRYTKRDSFLSWVSYFFVSSYWQGGLIKAYVKQARAQNPKQFRQIVAQYICVAGFHVTMIALATRLHGVRTGLVTYVCSFGATAAMGLWGMMAINYIQHIHCDPYSKYNQSRNFTGDLANWFVFNSGYHTAHHEKAGAHWSTLPQIHAKIADKIHPELNQPSIFGYILKAYVLGHVSPRFAPHQIGRAAYDVPKPEESMDLAA